MDLNMLWPIYSIYKIWEKLIPTKCGKRKKKSTLKWLVETIS